MLFVMSICISYLFIVLLQYKKALEFYSKAVDVQPMHAEAHCNTGVIHKNQGRLEEAVAAYERALEVAPSFQIVQSNLAIALTEQATHAKNAGNMAEGKCICWCGEVKKIILL